jgi:hypothetical protein
VRVGFGPASPARIYMTADFCTFLGDSAGRASSAGIALGLALLAGSPLAIGAEPKLLVFLHVAIKQRALQNELQAALQGIQVTAVGRVSDFERALADGQDAVLTLPLVLAARKLTGQLRGYRGGSGEEKYSIVAVDTPPDLARISVVGALDILGREGTNAFVHDLLQAKPRVERVTKVEDLLPLLQMQRVEAFLLPSRLFAELQQQSRLSLARRELPNGVGLPAIASVGALGPQVLPAIRRLPAQVKVMIGVDEWR